MSMRLDANIGALVGQPRCNQYGSDASHVGDVTSPYLSVTSLSTIP